jgi:Leucine-rich repeat (LRR) protein
MTAALIWNNVLFSNGVFLLVFIVLQLCYNQLSGSVPTQLGSLKNLNLLALQYNQITGAILATLGNLGTLQRLDLSFNRLFSSIPMKIADAPLFVDHFELFLKK